MLWLIGNKGMLGKELSLLLEKNNLPFIGTDREVDITDPAALSEFINAQANSGNSFIWIINCAAYTAVDKAEDDADNCRSLNTPGAGNIAACAKNIGAQFIHISTDYVFDGKGITTEGVRRPYREDDPTNPIGVYGITKRDGELAVMASNERSYIIRTAWLYGKHGNNFVNTMLRLMNERDEVNIVNDQRGSPTRAFDLARIIILMIRASVISPLSEAGMNVPFGIYHFTNEGNITWFDFAQEIYKQGRELGLIKKDCAVKPCTSAEFPAKVKRPAFSVLDKRKIKTALEIEIPAWDKSLRKFLKNNDDLKL
ncbi:MAG: dTDP-4-dehydrorhamnose reductase [Treponema sp.]|jgi:dTDP-4-dehydrorhamnose reductase|nr:dTDP-4-dehydrorhamnose reductase [Treponema sp.]